MPAQPFPLIRITDDVTTVTIATGTSAVTNHGITRGRWAPAIAPLRRSLIGGRGPYENVAEEFYINISGSSPADCLSKLQTLNLLLEQAERWYEGEAVNPVRFEYAIQGSTTLSTASPLKYLVYGRAPGDQTAGENHLIANERFNDAGMTSIMRDVRVRFYRHGVGTQGNQVASSAATNNGQRATVTLGAAETVPSPTLIQFTNFGYGGSATHKFESGLVVVTEASEDLQIVGAETLAPATDFTSVADAGSNANGNVLRFTPTVTTERLTSLNALSGITVKERTFAVYLCARNNSATANYKVRVGVYNYGDNYTPYLGIPATATPYPQWYFCGQLSLARAGGFNIRLACIASATGVGTLDIDSIALIDKRNPSNTVIGVLKETSTTVANIETLYVDHLLYTAPDPMVYPGIAPSGYSNARSHQGKIFISTKAASLSLALLATGSANSSFNYWRQTSSGAATVLQNTWTVTRERGYLTPP